MDVHPTKNGIFIGIDPYPYIEIWKMLGKCWNDLVKLWDDLMI